MDECPPYSTLFLHEDILACTLAYERDLQQWRTAELEAGQVDPGRPTYDEASDCFNLFGVMSHQYFRYLVAHQSHHIISICRQP
jgi:hypothetical protein